MPDKSIISSSFSRWFLYAIPLGVIIFCGGLVYRAINNEVTGVAREWKDFTGQNTVNQRKEPEKFRQRTNGLWIFCGVTFAIGVASFVTAQMINQHFSDDK